MKRIFTRLRSGKNTVAKETLALRLEECVIWSTTKRGVFFKQKRVVSKTAKSEKKIFVYGQKERIDVARTFTTGIVVD